VKRAQLRRHTPLRTKPRRQRARHDAAWLRYVHTLGCIARGRGECSGPIQAAHMTVALGLRGVGVKAPDRHAVPLCLWHHCSWDGRRGPFAGWTRDARLEQARAWVGQIWLAAHAEGAA